MDEKSHFNSKFLNLFFHWLGMNALLVVIAWITSCDSSWYGNVVVFGVVNVSYISNAFVRPVGVTIDHGNSALVISYVSWFRRPVVVPLDQLTWTYKKEIGARGSRIKEFRVFGGGSVKAKLSGVFGWDDKTLTQLFDKLNERKS